MTQNKSFIRRHKVAIGTAAALTGTAGAVIGGRAAFRNMTPANRIFVKHQLKRALLQRRFNAPGRRLARVERREAAAKEMIERKIDEHLFRFDTASRTKMNLLKGARARVRNVDPQGKLSAPGIVRAAFEQAGQERGMPRYGRGGPRPERERPPPPPGAEFGKKDKSGRVSGEEQRRRYDEWLKRQGKSY